MCTHNQCFRAKKEKYYNFLSENEHFYSREILLYIAWACLRNDDQANNLGFEVTKDSDLTGHLPSLINDLTVHLKKARVLHYPLST